MRDLSRNLASFINSLKQDFKVLKDARPGHRFRDYQQFRNDQAKKEGPWRRASHMLLGIALIVIGLAVGWLPGPGGFLSIIGVAMLVPLIPGAPILMDKTEVVIRQAVHRAWRSLRWCFGFGTH